MRIKRVFVCCERGGMVGALGSVVDWSAGGIRKQILCRGEMDESVIGGTLGREIALLKEREEVSCATKKTRKIRASGDGGREQSGKRYQTKSHSHTLRDYRMGKGCENGGRSVRGLQCEKGGR